jgi:hypothetical protein
MTLLSRAHKPDATYSTVNQPNRHDSTSETITPPRLVILGDHWRGLGVAQRFELAEVRQNASRSDLTPSE